MPSVEYSVHTLPEKINPSFARHLQETLQKKGLSTRGFATICGSSHGWIAKVMRAEVLPSEENIKSWAKSLKLSNAEEKKFLEEGYLVRSHEVIQQLVTKLRNHTIGPES